MSFQARTIPLLLTYMAFPAVNIFFNLLDRDITRNWIEVFWFALAALALIVILFNGKVRMKKKNWLLITASVLLILVFAVINLIVPFINHSVIMTPYIMEAKPVIYFLIAMLWLLAFGPLRPEDFLKWGAVLGFLMLATFSIESVIKGSPVRPVGTGEPNYEACLLLISLCMGFGIKAKRAWIFWIVIGILATMSRTALMTLASMVFIFGKLRFRSKVFFTLLLGAFFVLSFILRDLSLEGVQSVDRYWMWATGLSLLWDNPAQALIGFPAGVALPVDIPPMLEWLWSSQSEGWSVNGVFPFNLHAFWLRAAVTWGIIAVFAMLAFLSFITLHRKNPVLLRSLALLVILEGMTMGLFYLSNVAIPLMLAFALGLSQASAFKKPFAAKIKRELNGAEPA